MTNGFFDGMPKTGRKWNYINVVIRMQPRIYKPMEFIGIWEGQTNGTTYYYWLQDHGNCRWYENIPVTLTNFAPCDGKGDWKVIDDELRIEWETGSKETWDLPIARKGYNGKWVTDKGVSSPLSVKLIQKL